MTGVVRLFPKGQQPSTDWESWSACKNSKWWYHAESGKCVRSYTCPGDDWTNENANMTGTRMYIDDDEVIHQVLPEIAKEYGWVEFSHSQGKRLYSDGNEVHLFEHDKQPEGWQIYDEKFGKRMYDLPDGSRKWFAPDEIPEGAVEFCSTTGRRQYINRETDHIIQVPHGTQPEGYEEYSSTSGTIFMIDTLGTLRRSDIKHIEQNLAEGYVVRPTYRAGMYCHIDLSCMSEFWLDHISEINPPYNVVHGIVCRDFRQYHADLIY